MQENNENDRCKICLTIHHKNNECKFWELSDRSMIYREDSIYGDSDDDDCEMAYGRSRMRICELHELTKEVFVQQNHINFLKQKITELEAGRIRKKR